LADSPVSAELLGGVVKRVADDTISGKIAKQVFEAMWAGEGDADTIIDKKGLKQITDSGAIESIVDEVISANPDQAEQFKAGKEQLLGFFVGQVMKASKGQANPGQVNKILRDKLR
jgi:aspartyl-tRNA(Asn)/glutamyl-tRNA(Gln) amidotransferase subunit B